MGGSRGTDAAGEKDVPVTSFFCAAGQYCDGMDVPSLMLSEGGGEGAFLVYPRRGSPVVVTLLYRGDAPFCFPARSCRENCPTYPTRPPPRDVLRRLSVGM